MNTIPPAAETASGPRTVRGIADVKRASDDKMIAGVCAGFAKHFNIDPILLRVILAALTLVGFAGILLYLAAWLLLPAEDEPKSIAAQWFNLGENEQQWRTVGLAVTGILVVLAVAGFVPWHDGGLSWVALAVLAVGYFGIFKPVQHHRESSRQEAAAGAPSAPRDHDDTLVIDAPEQREPKTPWSPALTFLTLSASLIAVGVVALWAQTHQPLPWTSYAVAALGVIALGLLVGAWWGNGGLLILPGALIACALAVSTLLPSARIGHDVVPADPGTVSSNYALGIGQLDVNLVDLSDVSVLTGRTIGIKVGIGQTRIVVPSGTNVEVRSTLRAGEIKVFDRTVNGTQNTLNYPAANPDAPKLILRISQSIGGIDVIKQ